MKPWEMCGDTPGEQCLLLLCTYSYPHKPSSFSGSCDGFLIPQRKSSLILEIRNTRVLFTLIPELNNKDKTLVLRYRSEDRETHLTTSSQKCEMVSVNNGQKLRRRWHKRTTQHNTTQNTQTHSTGEETPQRRLAFRAWWSPTSENLSEDWFKSHRAFAFH